MLMGIIKNMFDGMIKEAINKKDAHKNNCYKNDSKILYDYTDKKTLYCKEYCQRPQWIAKNKGSKENTELSWLKEK